MVFTYLVAKGLFRIGVELTCPACSLRAWIALDALKQRNPCDLCGSEYDATRQLVNGEFHYRRTGVLGSERNVQGAIPVALVLQQLSINLSLRTHDCAYAPSYDLEPKDGTSLRKCEVDFVIVQPQPGRPRSSVVLGECKDEGDRINAKDVENLKQVADALPRDRFESFIALARLSPFTPEEVRLAKTLNGPYQMRTIMLTARELEPYHLYERTSEELGIDSHGGSLEELAKVSARIYFRTAADAEE
jgi:hypothetical protein